MELFNVSTVDTWYSFIHYLVITLVSQKVLQRMVERLVNDKLDNVGGSRRGII
jgi:hypothetical protein